MPRSIYIPIPAYTRSAIENGAGEQPNKSAIKWQPELTRAANKYHVIGCWVAVVFNALFSLNDYFVIPEEWFRFFVFRIAVSIVIFIALMLWKKYNYSTEWLVFIPFSLICVENAYIWSFMDVVNFRTHTLAYIAIYIGASMIVIWRYQFSLLIVAVSITANLIFLKTNSRLSFEEIMINGALLVASVSIFSVVLLYTRYNLTKKELIARLNLEESKEILNEQKIIIEENHRDITDSIRYAEKIQHSMLPALSDIQEHLPQSFVLFEPKDIVSGDFYWFSHRDGKSILAAVDCTGHGVPGALMSMLGSSLLNRIVNELGISEPAKILNELRNAIISTLKKNGTDLASGGMDMALCTIHHNERKIQYSGAFNALYQIRDGNLIQHNANRMPIGRYEGFEANPFTQCTIDAGVNDWFYIFSDGYADQFGGPENRKLGSKKFKELLSEISVYGPNRQKDKLSDFYRIWKDGQPPIDDVVIIGFKL